MPLPYTTVKPLNLPAEVFNADELATVVLHGYRDSNYMWRFQLYPNTGWDAESGKPIKALATVYGSLVASLEVSADRDRERDTAFRNSPEYRVRALESAVFWMITETRGREWRLAYMELWDDSIAEQDLSRLIIATFVIANERFVPDPQFPLLDEKITGQS